jgi:uncharacterized protein
MPRASVNGVTLHYEVTGEGFPLVFSHEFAGDGRSWAPQVRHFARLYRCVTYNHRGFPPSSVPETPGAYSQDLLVEDLRALLRHLDIAQAHLVGLSMGGNVVLNFALRYPELCRAAVVAGCGAGTTDRERFEDNVRRIVELLTAEGMEAFARIYSEGPTRLPFKRKDPAGWAEFREQLAAHSALGSALTMRGVQLRRPTVFSLAERLGGHRARAPGRPRLRLDRPGDGKVASAKHPRKWGRLFGCRAAFVAPPRPGAPIPPVRIALPDGTMVESDAPEGERQLSRALDREVRLGSSAPSRPVFEEHWPGEDAGEPFGQVLDRGADWTLTDVPMGVRAPEGTFFDFAAIHLLTTGTLDRLRAAYPRGRWEARRFRPNVVVETPGRADFVENDWVRRVIAIGEGVRLKVICPAMRCVMTTLPQGDLPREPEILRAAAQHNRIPVGQMGPVPCVGIYAGVLRGGTIRRNDPVTLE